MNRAFSLLSIKEVDENKRTISGIASTPTVDRMGDSVDPLGAVFSTPMPLLLYHKSDKPVGTVDFAKPNKNGIPFRASLPNVVEEGELKKRVDEAWHSIKYKLIAAVSIGFRALEGGVEILKNGGVKFTAWEWLELSLCSIPAQPEAVIQSFKSMDADGILAALGQSRADDAAERAALIKSLDTEQLAALGRTSRSDVVRLAPPGASGKSTKLSQAKEAKNVKTIEQQIADWEAKRAALAARQTEIMTKAAEAGATLDDAEGEEHDTLAGEIKGIDKHLVRLGEMQKSMKLQAKAVSGTNPDDASASRDFGRIQVSEPKLEKGIGFARLAKAMYISDKTKRPIEEIAKQMWPNYEPLQNLTKNVAAGTTTGTNWALPLVNYQILANEFAEFLRPQTIIGKFGTGNIPSLHQVPFNVKIPRQTTKGSAYWTGEGKPKYLTEWQMDSITLDFFKVATIAVITEELLRFSTPAAERLVRDELARAVIERIDIDFVDPNKASSAAVSPASITYGAFTAASSGDNAAAIIADVQSIFQPFNQANLDLGSAVWIMNANVALGLSLILTTNGTPQFPGMTMQGGTFMGIPVLVSQYVPTALVILVAANEILLADDGNVTIDMSREASLEMLATGSSQTAVTGTGASLVSMFQTNSVAFRAEREINWAKRRSSAVAYLTSANWGGAVGSGDI